MTFLKRLFRERIPLDFSGMTDWHCHILPAVDDGVRRMEDSLAILSAYEDMGISEVWLTPHIMEDIPNETAELRKRFDILKAAYGGQIKLNLAAENMMDRVLDQRLPSADILPIGRAADTLLIETSYFNPPMNLDTVLDKIIAAGLTPLVAHPERYVYMQDISDYAGWKEKGCLFQLNLLSLGGHYGPGAEKKAHLMLTCGMYDFVGTDLHRPSQLDMLRNLRLSSSAAEKVSRIIADKKAH